MPQPLSLMLQKQDICHEAQKKVNLLADVWFDILNQTSCFLPHSFLIGQKVV